MADEDKTEQVLDRIRTLQLYSQNGYDKALKEIRAGHKDSHWIWYIWPTLEGVRTTTRQNLHLPNFVAAKRYLECPTLSARLVEISEAATTHLQQGVSPVSMFGEIDAEKFHETMTFFAVAATELRNEQQTATFIKALDALPTGGKLHQRTMEILCQTSELEKYRGTTTTVQLRSSGS